MAAGLPPHVALGTNKGQSVFGSATALLRYWRAGFVHVDRARVAFPAGFIGALVGAQLVLFVPADALRPLVIVLLGFVAVFLMARPSAPRRRLLGLVGDRRALVAAIALAIGGYDGFFGPGTGTFLIIASVVFFDSDLTTASANAKVVNFASNAASVLLFSAGGTVAWGVALPMAAAQLAGSFLGARYAVTGGDRVVRPIMLCVVFALVGKLGFDLLD